MLVVDDEQSIVTLLKYNLEQSGYVVEVAQDGEEALQKRKETKPDLIVLDVMLPKRMALKYVKRFAQIKPSTYFNVNCKR